MIKNHRKSVFRSATTLLISVLFLCSCRLSLPPDESGSPGRTVIFTGEKPEGEGIYSGSDGCRRCHLPAYTAWTGTKHARSLKSLEVKNADSNPVCLRCHSTGYGFSSGYGDGTDGGLDSVGCEACHGPSAAHAASGGRMPTPAGIRTDCPPCVINEVCRLCHTSSWSPDFTLSGYFDKVACPDAAGQK